MERLNFHESMPVLAAEDIAAMSDADHVSFHMLRGGLFEVRCHIDSRPIDSFTAKQRRLYPEVSPYNYEGEWRADRRRDIRVHGRTHGYTGSMGMWTASPEGTPECVAFESVTGSRYDPALRTILSLLRPGHMFGILFTADNNTETVREAGLHIDMLSVHIGQPKQNRVLSFLLSVGVCKDNTARMVKRNGVYNAS